MNRRTSSSFTCTAFVVAAGLVATLWPADALAQRAVPRPPGRPVPVRPIYRPYYPYYAPFYYGYPYYGGFYNGYYSPFFFGMSFGPHGYPYPYAYGPYPYYGWAYDNTGSARLQVTPRNAKVYVDGHYVGLVDDFDGNLQRLNVEAGEHELQLYLEGYRSVTQKVLLTRGRTLKITTAMQPLDPGEAQPPVPQAQEAPRARTYRAPSDQRPDQRPGPPPSRGGQQSEFGSLLLRVRPADAEILLDGEVWSAPKGEDQFVIELADGSHRIEVRKSGFQTYSTTVRVRRGETVRLNVSLTAGGQVGAN